ncbi:MAG TPA: hypothetical protein VGC41_26030 [Kofleriaceae bacterium]
MLARIFAALIALCLVGGAVQAANFQVASTAAVELDDRSIDLLLPDVPVLTVAPQRHLILVEMPAIQTPVTASVPSRTFRPPEA